MHELKNEPFPQYQTVSQQPHAPIIKVAAKALINRKIPLMEYGSQVEWRYGYPLVLLVRNQCFLFRDWAILTSSCSWLSG